MRKIYSIFLVFLIVSLFFSVYEIDQVKSQSQGGSFGNTNIQSTDHDCGSYQSMNRFLFIESQSGTYTGESISVYYDVDEPNNNCSFALYFDNLTLYQYCEEEVNATVQDDYWITLNFHTPKPIFENNTYYWLSWWQSDVDGGADSFEMHREATGGEHKYKSYNYQNNYPNWDDPYVQSGSNAFLVSVYCNYTISGAGETFDLNPSMNIEFSLSSMHQFYGTYTVSSFIDLNFDLSSTTSFSETFFISPSIDLVFGLASSLEHFAGMVYHLFPSIDLTFDISSVSKFFGTYVINPIINLEFSLSSFAEWISGIIHINPSIVLVFDLGNVVSGGVLELGYDVTDALGIAILSLIIAIICICIAVTNIKKG